MKRRRVIRDLTRNEITALEFLWKWKLASTQLLKEVAFKKYSNWSAYKILRKLYDEGYLDFAPKGKYLPQKLWCLSKKGFETFLLNRDDLTNQRYRVHAPAHDYLGTTFQLGDLLGSKNIPVELFSEQELASLPRTVFPFSMQHSSHIPDGMTVFGSGKEKLIIGYEVDLNLKDKERYKTSGFDHTISLKTNIVFWLCRNLWIAKQISRIMQEVANDCRYDKTHHAFVLMDDFISYGWLAPIRLGFEEGSTVRKVHEKCIQKHIKTDANLGQKNNLLFYFPKHRSPQKLETYAS